MRITKIFLVSIIILNFCAPVFVYADTNLPSPPQNLDEAKQLGEKALEVGQKQMPGMIQEIWQNEVLPIWQKMFDWVKTNIWENWLKSWLENIWQSATRIFKSEVRQRTPAVKENFQTQKEQLKEEVPVVGKSLWEKFQELIK